MGILSTYASGYARLYHNDEEELRACLGENARARTGGLGTIDPENPQLHWWPSSVDFREEAQRHSRSAVGVGSFAALLQAIRRHPNLDQVLWFGHGAPSGELQFGGGSRFGMTDVVHLANADVSSHFAGGGTIALYACNAGQRPEFLQAIANATRVRVCGFTTGVRWELQYSGSSPQRRITRRGIHGGTLPNPTSCAAPQ